MKRRKTRGWLLLIVLGGVGLNGCLPNRLPPEPIEQERPQYLTLLSPDAIYVEDPADSARLLELRLTAQTGFPVSRDPTFRLGFSEPMDLSTFPDHVFLVSGTDTLRGEFSGGTESDTVRLGDTLIYVVTFTPPSLDPLRPYFLRVLGGVRDTAGNSLSIDPDFSLTYEFVTEGETPTRYRLLLADRMNGAVMAVDTFRLWPFTTSLAQPTRFAQVSGAVAITDEANASGYLKLFDLDNGSVMDSIRLGAHQNGLFLWGDALAVTTKSPRAYYLLDRVSLQVVDSGHISITPKRVAMNDDYIYILGTTRAILAIDRISGEETVISGALRAPLRSPSMSVNVNGIVAVNDYSGERILLIRDTDTSYVPLPGLHPTDVESGGGMDFWVTTEEGSLVEISEDGVVKGEFSLPGGATSITVYGDYLYVYMPDLSAGGETGFLVLLGGLREGAQGSGGEVLRGIPVGNTFSEIRLFPL